MLHSKKFGLAGGIIWGLCMFVSTIVSMYTGYAKQWLILMSDIYPGYRISGWGSLLGLIYGFLDAFIGLFLLAWLYNKFLECKKKK
jgi:hypothetical protein